MNTMTKKRLVVLACLCLLLTKSFAITDSKMLAPQEVTAGTSTQCDYYFIDTYHGVVLPGTSATPPSGRELALQFFNNTGVFNETNVSPLAATPEVLCAGKYKIVYSILVQATTQVNSITIVSTIQKNQSTVIYNKSANIYPRCVYGNAYTCSLSEISGAVTVSLAKGDQIRAPALVATDTIKVVGGQFELYYINEPTP